MVTDVMVHDIFSPPVASRVYAYASLAAYEVAALADEEYASLMGQLNEFEKKEFDVSKECLFPLAALAAYYQVAASMIFSDEPMMAQRDRVYQKIKDQGIPSEVFQNSLDLGKEVADHVMAYASGDNYHQSRSFEKYTISTDEGAWKPTPPAYMEGLEPHWEKIRPFVMDSASQFVPDRPSPFDIIPESDFYKEAEAVMLAKNNITPEEEEIAQLEQTLEEVDDELTDAEEARAEPADLESLRTVIERLSERLEGLEAQEGDARISSLESRLQEPALLDVFRIELHGNNLARAVAQELQCVESVVCTQVENTRALDRRKSLPEHESPSPVPGVVVP